MTVTTPGVPKCGDSTNMYQYREHRKDYNSITDQIMMSCYFNSHRADCMNQAIESQLGFTKDCAPCHGTMIQCALTNCMAKCMAGKFTPSCLACVAQHCTPDMA